MVVVVWALVMVRAQPTVSTRQIDVSETAGIRRTEYPVTASVELPRGTLRDASNGRLKLTEDVMAQFTAETRWDDGSVRALSVDFNVSLGPAERRRYILEFGPDVNIANVQPDVVIGLEALRCGLSVVGPERRDEAAE